MERSFIKLGVKGSPRPVFKKSKLNISLDERSEMLHSLFLLHVQLEVYQKRRRRQVLLLPYVKFL